jgi:hypothetical protein
MMEAPRRQPTAKFGRTDPMKNGATALVRTAPAIKAHARIALVISDPKATGHRATDHKATDPKATDPKATDPKATDPKATDPKATGHRATDPKATGHRGAVSVLLARIDVARARSAGSARSRSGPRRCRTRRS